VYESDRGSWLVTGLQLERTLYFSAEVGGGERVVLFLYTNLHCTCENMLFWKGRRKFGLGPSACKGPAQPCLEWAGG